MSLYFGVYEDRCWAGKARTGNNRARRQLGQGQKFLADFFMSGISLFVKSEIPGASKVSILREEWDVKLFERDVIVEVKVSEKKTERIIGNFGTPDN